MAASPLQLAFLSLRVHEYDDPDRVDHRPSIAAAAAAAAASAATAQSSVCILLLPLVLLFSHPPIDRPIILSVLVRRVATGTAASSHQCATGKRARSA